MSLTAIQVFRPNIAATKRITANTSGTAVLIDGDPQGRDYQVRIRNYGSADVHIAFGPVVGTTAVIPVAGGAAGNIGISAGTTEVLTVKGNYIAVISAGTPAIEVTPGYGA